jgi:predicted DNA-binding transcriptional regulator YafY
MLETSARLLRLLSLLQSRRDWTSGELAQRLDVTTRTIRNDVDRLRALGYPVEARPGVTGGYRLGATGAMPPLLLDDEEAVAVAIGLRTAASGSIAGIEEASLLALSKLHHVLPARLRHRIDAFRVIIAPVAEGSRVDPAVLTAVAGACRDRERLRFDYRTHSGAEQRREVEPYRLVHHRRRWYLIAWDLQRSDWRTFRLDRLSPRIPSGPRFVPRALPSDDDIAQRLASGVGTATWQYRARVLVHASAEHVRSRIPVPIDVEPIDENRCVFEPGSDYPVMLALYLGMVDADFEIIDAPELVEALRLLVGRFGRAIASAEATSSTVRRGPPAPERAAPAPP